MNTLPCGRTGDVSRYPLGDPHGTLAVSKGASPHFRPSSCTGPPEISDIKAIAVVRVTVTCRPLAALHPVPRASRTVSM